jgi:hypothetical protein
MARSCGGTSMPSARADISLQKKTSPLAASGELIVDPFFGSGPWGEVAAAKPPVPAFADFEMVYSCRRLFNGTGIAPKVLIATVPLTVPNGVAIEPCELRSDPAHVGFEKRNLPFPYHPLVSAPAFELGAREAEADEQALRAASTTGRYVRTASASLSVPKTLFSMISSPSTPHRTLSCQSSTRYGVTARAPAPVVVT